MDNLAFVIPQDEMESDAFLFVGQEDPLFDKINRTCPPPKALIISRREFALSSEDHHRLAAAKPRHVAEIRARIAAIDETVSKELQFAKVPLIEQEKRVTEREVPTKYRGDIAGCTFTRAWRYWVVEVRRTVSNPTGALPPDLARRIFLDPEAKGSIRLNGDARNLSPEGVSAEFYHIDTQEGLNIFVEYLTGKR